MDDRRGLNVERAAAYLGVSRNTLLRLAKTEPLLKAIMISPRRVIWDRKDLDKYITKMKKQTP